VGGLLEDRSRQRRILAEPDQWRHPRPGRSDGAASGRHWSAIVRVAKVLAAEGELGGARIETLVR
jgi:hypothetical protein